MVYYCHLLKKMNIVSLFRKRMNHKLLILMLCMNILYASQSFAQLVGIRNGNGSPLTTTWCYEDTMHALQGIPAGGEFSGCGIEEKNGIFYFNPKLAAEGATKFIHNCTITYTPPASTGYSKVYRTMSVNAPIVIDAGGDRIICKHGTVELPVYSAYGASYQYKWSPGKFLVDSTKNPAKGSISIHGSQTFYLTVEDVNSGCLSYDTVTLYDKSVFAEVLENIPDTICKGGSLSLSARPYDNYTYHWFVGENEVMDGLEFKHDYNNGGDHLLMLVVQDKFCPDTVKHNIHVLDFQLQLSASQQQLELVEEITLSSANAFKDYYITSWQPSHLFPDQTAYSQSIIADSTRQYTITGATSFGCVDTASTFVTIIPRIFMPNSFSPNGDGLNDIFQIVSLGDAIEVLDFEIYDRWGRKVWYGRGNSYTTGWDGTSKGITMDVGTYFYILKAVTRQGEPFNKQGDVILIR
jgi:gliding motility-associated-like protein